MSIIPIDIGKLEKIQEKANNLLSCDEEVCRMTYKVEIKVSEEEENTVIVELVVTGSPADCHYPLADHGPALLTLVLDDTAIMPTMQVGTWSEGRKCECISRIKLGYFLIMIAMEIAKEHGYKEIEFDDMSSIKDYYEKCGATRLEEGLPEMVFGDLSEPFINALFNKIREKPRPTSGIKYNVNIDSVFSTINMETLFNTLLMTKKWKKHVHSGAGGGAAASVETGNPAKRAKLDHSSTNGGRRLTKRRRKNKKKKKKRKTRRKRTRKKN